MRFYDVVFWWFMVGAVVWLAVVFFHIGWFWWDMTNVGCMILLVIAWERERRRQ